MPVPHAAPSCRSLVPGRDAGTPCRSLIAVPNAGGPHRCLFYSLPPVRRPLPLPVPPASASCPSLPAVPHAASSCYCRMPLPPLVHHASLCRSLPRFPLPLPLCEVSLCQWTCTQTCRTGFLSKTWLRPIEHVSQVALEPVCYSHV
jgi:hypothetical protein